MATFVDDRQREWVVRLDHALLLNIRKRLGINLHRMSEQAKALDRMADDPELLVNVIYLACEEQCKQREISDEDFGRGFAEGETLQRACHALQEAILSFMQPQRRELVKRTIQATLGATKAAEDLLTSIVEKATTEASQMTISGA